MLGVSVQCFRLFYKALELLDSSRDCGLDILAFACGPDQDILISQVRLARVVKRVSYTQGADGSD